MECMWNGKKNKEREVKDDFKLIWMNKWKNGIEMGQIVGVDLLRENQSFFKVVNWGYES